MSPEYAPRREQHSAPARPVDSVTEPRRPRPLPPIGIVPVAGLLHALPPLRRTPEPAEPSTPPGGVNPAIRLGRDDPRSASEKRAAVDAATDAAAGVLARTDDLDAASTALGDIRKRHSVAEICVTDAETAWELEVSLNPKALKTVPKPNATPKKRKKPVQRGVLKPKRRRKHWKSRLGRGKISDKFDENEEYSDSEDESDYNTNYGYESGHIVNVTKTGPRKKGVPHDKVDNTIDASNLAQAVSSLQADATTIHDLIPADSRSFGATTISTAIVNRADGRGYRKFVFCNLDGNLPPLLRHKAEELGYHVIRAPQAHAEGQMLQYLQSRSSVYTVHSMGCDKEHCQECEWAMDVYFGTYKTESGFSGKVFKNWYNPPPLQEALGRKGDASTPHRDSSGNRT